jgi:hypothetical protein
MPRSCTKHRLTPQTFLLSILHKLLLPINPNRTPCTSGHHEHDIYGDHAFCCEQGSKTREHIIIAMDFAGALSPVLAQAGYLFPNTPMAVEQLFHLHSDSTAGPFGISSLLIPQHAIINHTPLLGQTSTSPGPRLPPRPRPTNLMLKTFSKHNHCQIRQQSSTP